MSENIHPLILPINELTSDELDKKLSELINKWRIARQMNMGEDVTYQLDLMISNIEEEKYRRLAQEEQPDGVVIDTDPIENLPNIPKRMVK